MSSRWNGVFGLVSCAVRAAAGWRRGDMPACGRSAVSAVFARAAAGVTPALVTHVLLAVSCVLRRADGADVIGAALRAKAAGVGHRPIAAVLGRPVSTVRGWLRAFAGNAETVRGLLTALLVQLDPLTAPLPVHPGVVADAVEVVGACAAAARRRLGVIGAVSPWQLASAVTGGRLLAPRLSAVSINTSRPLGSGV